MAHTSENTSGYLSLTATAAAIGLGVRVKIDSSGNISAAGATDHWIGVTTSAVAASGVGTVRLRNSPGTYMVVAAGAISVGSRLYAAADGKFNDVQSAGNATGLIAKSAAGADGDIIEAVPASDNAAAGVWAFPITLANVANGDLLAGFTPGFAGTITKTQFAVTTVVPTAAKATTLNLEIGTTNLTGGEVALTSANCATVTTVAGAAITAANTFGASDAISIEASATTTFIEGAGLLLVSYVTN